MKALVQLIQTNPKYALVMELGRVLSLTGSAQIIIQVVSLCSGILIIRQLPSDEYALYIIANTMLGTMTMLADGGITSGVMAEGGKVWKDRMGLGKVLSTGFSLRKKFAVISLLVTIPVLFFLLRNNGASLLTSTLILAALIPAFLYELSGSMLHIGLLLKGDLKMQKIEVIANLMRLAAVAATSFVFPWAFIAILAASVPRFWANNQLRIATVPHAELNQVKDLSLEGTILKVVKRQMPGVLYFCVSGQITIWLMSILGSTTSVAQIGALGRIAIVVTLMSAMVSNFISPRFARVAEIDKHSLLKFFLQINFGITCICVAIVLLVYNFSDYLLLILGPNYYNLNKELLIFISTSCIGLLSSTAYVLSACRGWIINPLISIPTNICVIIIGIMVFDYNTLTSFLYFNLFLVIGQFFLNFTFILLKLIPIKNLNINI